MTNQERIYFLMEALKLTTTETMSYGLPTLHQVSIWTPEQFFALKEELFNTLNSI